MEHNNSKNEPEDVTLNEDEYVVVTENDIKISNIQIMPGENLNKKSEKAESEDNDVLTTTLCENKEEQYALSTDDGIDIQILEVEKEFEEWTKLRRDTILKLRDIADYIDSVSKKSGIAKAIGSGGGAIGGGLTLIGGILTIASAGAALPVLLAGTSIGLASGIGGGAAAITEKIIKSRQLKQAQESIDADKKATCHLEEDIVKLRSNKKVVNKIAKDVVLSSGSAAYDSVQIFNLVAGKAGAASTLKAGIEATAQLLGEDVGKEVSKILLRTSGKVLSGGITVVFGGLTMAYDIYKLSTEVEAIATKQAGDEFREIANQLEIALDTFLTGCSNSSNELDCDTTIPAGISKDEQENSSRKSHKVLSSITQEPDLEKSKENNSYVLVNNVS